MVGIESKDVVVVERHLVLADLEGGHGHFMSGLFIWVAFALYRTHEEFIAFQRDHRRRGKTDPSNLDGQQSRGHAEVRLVLDCPPRSVACCPEQSNQDAEGSIAQPAQPAAGAEVAGGALADRGAGAAEVTQLAAAREDIAQTRPTALLPLFGEDLQEAPVLELLAVLLYPVVECLPVGLAAAVAAQQRLVSEVDQSVRLAVAAVRAA